MNQATTAATMRNLENGLGSVLCGLTSDNYEKRLGFYRFRFEIGQTYSQIPPDLIFSSIWNHKHRLPSAPDQYHIYPASLAILRFATDAESCDTLHLHSAGLRNRLCTSILQEFFDLCMDDSFGGYFFVDVNIIAHAANLGYIEETVIRNHILQSVMLYDDLHGDRLEAVIIFFKKAGATFEAYADPSAVERCFELLRDRLSASGSYDLCQRIEVSEPLEGSLVGTKTILRR